MKKLFSIAYLVEEAENNFIKLENYTCSKPLVAERVTTKKIWKEAYLAKSGCRGPKQRAT
jgi:hypothetical protein